MHKTLRLKVAALAASLSLCLSSVAQDAEPFWLGADISGTTELEARGGKLYNAKGELRENTALMYELGLNAIRLRVWVNPEGGFCSPADVLIMAKRAKYYGLPVMIDFHYSDWWADPAHQTVPATWQYLNQYELKEVLRNHTRNTLKMLRDADVDVRWVQVGNETSNGFIWPKAKASENMQAYAELTQVGYDAVKEVYPQAQVIIHLDGGSDPTHCDFILGGLQEYNTKWDVIGLSVYPYWDHKAGTTETDQETLDKFSANIVYLAKKYGKDVIVVETGVEAARPAEGKKLLADIIHYAKDKTEGHCHGVFYWAPEAEGGYALGASHNGHITEIMEAFTEAAKK